MSDEKNLAVCCLLSATCSSVAVANTCYTVEGEVKTANVSPVMQVGSIDLQWYDDDDNEVFNQSGHLSGTITGGEMGRMYLSHSAGFDDGSEFHTTGDVAYIMGIRKVGADGMPCAFDVHEVISEIASGTGFFCAVSDVLINADGYVDSCIAEGDNENEFELSGSLCVD